MRQRMLAESPEQTATVDAAEAETRVAALPEKFMAESDSDAEEEPAPQVVFFAPPSERSL